MRLEHSHGITVTPCVACTSISTQSQPAVPVHNLLKRQLASVSRRLFNLPRCSGVTESHSMPTTYTVPFTLSPFYWTLSVFLQHPLTLATLVLEFYNGAVKTVVAALKEFTRLLSLHVVVMKMMW